MKIESKELSKRIQDLEIVEHDKQEAANLEQELRNNISELEEQLVEKNKVTTSFNFIGCYIDMKLVMCFSDFAFSNCLNMST
jgi:hypothetical protein